MEMPRIIKLNEIVATIANDTRVCMLCRYRGMNDYQKFYGADAAKLPQDILNSLCVEKIWPTLEVFSGGIVVTLNIAASDDVSYISFNPQWLFGNPDVNQEFHPEPPEDSEEV